MQELTWLQKATVVGKAEIRKRLQVSNTASILDTETSLLALPVWQKTSTTAGTVTLDEIIGAARLVKCPIGDGDIARLEVFYTVLRSIERSINLGQDGFIRSFLRDVEFHHHQSTNGRYNSELTRFERWGVKPVAKWQSQRSGLGEHLTASKRHFHRIKDELIERGIIVAESHQWNGKNMLWIKPTEHLSRMVFEPGYWDTCKQSFKICPIPVSAPEKKKAPRGLSAKHAVIDAELAALYKKIRAPNSLSEQERWDVWKKLTTPIDISVNYSKAPFAVKGTFKYRRIWEALGLEY